MRTTINIDDDLLERLKRKAAEESRSLQDVTNELLRHALVLSDRPHPYECALTAWQAKLRPAVDLFDRDHLLDLLDESDE